jgi:hypothetical protein
MVFQRCSDVVESRVEQAILDAESRRDAAQIRNSPGALAFWGTRGLLTTTRRGEPALSVDQFGKLSNDHISDRHPGRLGTQKRRSVIIAVITLLIFITQDLMPSSHCYGATGG